MSSAHPWAVSIAAFVAVLPCDAFLWIDTNIIITINRQKGLCWWLVEPSPKVYSQSSWSLVKLGLGQRVPRGNSLQAGAGCRPEAAVIPQSAPAPRAPSRGDHFSHGSAAPAAPGLHCAQSPGLQPGGSCSSGVPAVG